MKTLILLFSFYTLANEPTSTIPDRRDFPLNTAVSPCQDFHAYVCSKAEAGFKLRDDRSKHTFAFNDSSERILDFKKNFLLNIGKNTGLSPRAKQVRDFYMACMNEKASAASEKKEVLKRIADMKKIKSAAELIVFNNKNNPSSLGSLYSGGPSNNLDDPKKLDLFVGANFLNLPDQKYYENVELMKDYEKLLTLFYKTIDPGISAADALKRAKNEIDLEKDFAKVYPVPAVRRQRWAEKRVSSQADFLKKYPELKADMMFKFIPKETLINTPIPESLEFLNANLTKYSLETWKDVYLYKNLEDLLDDGYQDYFNAQFEFQRKYFGGPEKRAARDERCTKSVGSYFLKELDAEVVQLMFPSFDDAKFESLAEKIRASIMTGLEKNTWLSKEAKEGAIKKIKTARLQLVRPHTDREWDFNLLRTYSARDAIANAHKYAEAQWEKGMNQLKEPANQDAWHMGPLTVNAYYSGSDNKFVMPIGILQYPFYDQNNLDIENLAAVGSVIGHELGHSIDDNGSKYDFEGKLKAWMPMKDLAQFNERTLKLVDQFNKAGHDGKLTLGENVADLVGLTFAHQAAFPEGKASKEDEQKFFIAYARSWCTVIRPDFAKLMLKTDPHASGVARINEQMKQQPRFAEAFSCKSGDKMVLPEKERVKIW